MDRQKEAEKVIKAINELWEAYNSPQTQEAKTRIMNTFCARRRWLSDRGIGYHQNPQNGKWELLNVVTQ